MLSLFDINTIFLDLPGYPLSYIELIGIVTGLLSVWFAARSNILTWPIGLLNVVAFFFLFYQVRLYSDMLLQVFFFVTTCYGWYYWLNQDRNKVERKITTVSRRTRILTVLAILFGTVLLGYTMSRIHHDLPSHFPEPAAFPFPDAFTTVLSIAATFLLAMRKIEAWILWITVDVVAIFLYALKGIVFTSALYFVFLLIASFGLYHWIQLYRHENGNTAREISAAP